MFEAVLSFLDSHKSFILTTHDAPDADGLGAELVMAAILKNTGKDARIINSSPVPEYLQFLITDIKTEIEVWDLHKHSPLLENSAMLILDTSEEIHLGAVREALKMTKANYVIDHHELKPVSKLAGFIDPTSSSTSELMIELACLTGTGLDQKTATAAYAGIVFDTGFFAYPKTTERTFRAAIKTYEWGAAPNHIYRQLMENSSCAAVLLQRQALSNLEFLSEKKIALIILKKEDFEISGAEFEDVENIVNIPLKAREVEISLLLKEKSSGEIFCSLRSKGAVNVSKIARNFGGGGHITAAGFRSSSGLDETVKNLLDCVESRLNM